MQMRLGSGFARLGEHEGETERLEEAVDAYRAVLQKFTCDRVPGNWAHTQNNLRSALRKNAWRREGIGLLQKARSHKSSALEVFEAAEAYAEISRRSLMQTDAPPAPP